MKALTDVGLSCSSSESHQVVLLQY